MALSKIKFIKGEGGLGKTAAGQDYISALLFFLPTAADEELTKEEYPFKGLTQIFSLAEAEALHITDAEETILVDTEGVETARFDNHYKMMHYHISEYFRANPSGSLYVGAYTEEITDEAFDLGKNAERLRDMQLAAEGAIRQAGIFLADRHTPVAKADIATIASTFQGVCDDLEENYYMPLSVLVSPDLKALGDAAHKNLEDLSTGAYPKVSVVIGQDAEGKAAELFKEFECSVTCLGTVIGTISKAAVHENIGWVRKFDVSGAALNTLSLSNGALVKKMTSTELEAIDNANYIFLQKHHGANGSYFNGSWTASSGDYENIELNRVIDKAIRGIREMMLPNLN
ncbi:DUF2586 family protein, partial [Xanthovirga aplysinae]|uniref:DUF2586 family protein n=1 Tax=Xanthovirga aplysinae TaxID=2529853 RepID=UPI0012BBF64B